MKKIIFCLALSMGLQKAFSQSIDTNFIHFVGSTNWSASGEDIVFNVLKVDKSRKLPPLSKIFVYNLASGKTTDLKIEGNGPSISPDGKTIAYGRRNETRKANIYLFDRNSWKETTLVADTFNKSAPVWSNDGKKIAYNRESNGSGQFATLEICVIDLATKEIKQVTESGKFKSYSPAWAPSGDKIVYYFEKGDQHDQIWLTDANGSFHNNLTNDTSTHNYFPSWTDEKTIAWTLSPGQIMTMNIDGSHKTKVEGLNASSMKYNLATDQAVYVTPMPGIQLMLYNWEKKTTKVLLDNDAINALVP